MSQHKIRLDNQEILCHAGESVLDALLREQIDIPYACNEGACQSCMIRSLAGAPPAKAQQGLKDILQHQQYFLACLCYPHQDMHISLNSPASNFTAAIVIDKQLLNPETLLLSLQLQAPMDFYAGQFVNLKRADGLMRSYSIANNRINAQKLTFHIRRLAGGRFSEWAHQDLNIGDVIAVSDPQGLCYYLPNKPQQNLLLIGTGSGLAPLAGIISEALHHGHHGQIHLYHGSREIDGLYWIAEMQQLAHQYPNFHYTACVSGESVPEGIVQGRANDLAFTAIKNLKDWRVFLCGHPEMVKQSKRQAYLNGAGLQDIHADAFHVASATLD
jgi:NAD(P)H-flavin reductase/ferredoxin